ncbi:MAG TPA: hypothetical protein VFH68_19045 [Polyangia bacterium]|jgi:hypothetical protein|nr:hypothetical protein [Polyangia bacterium]
MSTTSSHRSLSAAAVSPILAVACVATLAACSSTNSAAPPPAVDGAAGSITYWLAPRTSEVDLKLVTTQPTQAF